MNLKKLTLTDLAGSAPNARQLTATAVSSSGLRAAKRRGLAEDRCDDKRGNIFRKAFSKRCPRGPLLKFCARRVTSAVKNAGEFAVRCFRAAFGDKGVVL